MRAGVGSQSIDLFGNDVERGLEPQGIVSAGQVPIDCLGDPGAALGPVLMALASIGISKGYVEGPCLVWAASDGGERGAAVIAGAGV